MVQQCAGQLWKLELNSGYASDVRHHTDRKLKIFHFGLQAYPITIYRSYLLSKACALGAHPQKVQNTYVQERGELRPATTAIISLGD